MSNIVPTSKIYDFASIVPSSTIGRGRKRACDNSREVVKGQDTSTTRARHCNLFGPKSILRINGWPEHNSLVGQIMSLFMLILLLVEFLALVLLVRLFF